MKRTKMSLANIQNRLSRTEMRAIMAGSGFGGCSNDKCDKQSCELVGCENPGECRINKNTGNCACMGFCA